MIGNPSKRERELLQEVTLLQRQLKAKENQLKDVVRQRDRLSLLAARQRELIEACTGGLSLLVSGVHTQHASLCDDDRERLKAQFAARDADDRT